jgi:hypothetical protein
MMTVEMNNNTMLIANTIINKKTMYHIHCRGTSDAALSRLLLLHKVKEWRKLYY